MQETTEYFGRFQTTLELVRVADKYRAVQLIPICELTLEDELGRRAFSRFHLGGDCL